MSPQKLPENLAAGAARRGQFVSVGGHRDTPELARAFGDGLEDGDAFGANGQTVSSVLDVAAGEDPAVLGFNCGAHAEFGKRSVCVGSGGKCGIG